MKLRVAVCSVLLLTPLALRAQEKIPLWPNGAPGFEDRKDVPEVAESYYVREIHNPSIAAYFPPADKANGAAVLVVPGGGHSLLVYNAEGKAPAEYLNKLGVTAFILKHRLGRDTKSTFPPYDIAKHATEDAHRALRLIRSRASEWKIDPTRLGIMGFSAGGEVNSLVAFTPGEGDANASDPIDRLNGRPDFAVYIYPGGIGIPPDGTPIAKDAPPAFLCVALDDRGALGNIERIYRKYRDAGASVELHVYAQGEHAFNMGTNRPRLSSIQHWPDRLGDWLADSGFLDPKKREENAKLQQQAQERRERQRQERNKADQKSDQKKE